MDMISILCIIPTAYSNETSVLFSRCLNSLRLASRNKVKLIVIVVTTTRIPKDIQCKYCIDEIIYIRKFNGYAQSVNLGIAKSIHKYDSEYVLLINDDAFISNSFFYYFIRLISKDNPEIIVPIIYKAAHTNAIDCFGIEYFKSGFARNSSIESRETTLASATCLLIRTQFTVRMISQFGYLFNPIFNSYYEDVDFSIRALLQQAHIYKSRHMKAHHVGSKSFMIEEDYILYQNLRNSIWIIFICWPIKYILQYSLYVFFVHVWLFICTLRDVKFDIYPKILVDTFLNMRSIYVSRRLIARQCINTNSFSEIFSSCIYRTMRTGVGI